MSEQNNEKELKAELTRLVEAAYAALSEAESFADMYKLSFNFQPAYGMGGTYTGDPEEYEWVKREYGEDADTGWISSSMGC